MFAIDKSLFEAGKGLTAAQESNNRDVLPEPRNERTGRFFVCSQNAAVSILGSHPISVAGAARKEAHRASKADRPFTASAAFHLLLTRRPAGIAQKTRTDRRYRMPTRIEDRRILCLVSTHPAIHTPVAGSSFYSSLADVAAIRHFLHEVRARPTHGGGVTWFVNGVPALSRIRTADWG